MVPLREHQQRDLQNIRGAFRRGVRKVMLEKPTGSGKTHVAAAMMAGTLENDRKVCFIADLKELVKQTSERLWELDIEHGVAQGENTYGRLLPGQVCSAQTLERREGIPDADLYIIDEAHSMRAKIVEFVKATESRVIGLSATPLTPGLGEVYEELINSDTTDYLVSEGWLVPLKVYIGTEIDMEGVPVTAGEWRTKQAAERTLAIVGDIVSEWVAHTMRIYGQPMKTLVYSASVDDGAELCRQFQAAGYRFEQISYRDKENERTYKIRGFREGWIIGLVSCEALSKGFDAPDAQILVDARCYRKSLMAQLQKLGRIMRPSPGKEFGLVLDHAGNYIRFASALEEFWASGVEAFTEKAQEKVKGKLEDRPDEERKCLSCGFVMSTGIMVCPSCGLARVARKPHVTQPKAGVMREYQRLSEEVGDIWPHVSRLALDIHPLSSERALKLAKAQYKGLTGGWPVYGRGLEPVDSVDPRVADAALRNFKRWIIAQKKGKEKEDG